uniref:Putative Chromate transport protein ChrA n=1 Tax=mine drainage metagenome TaxID=410659 RepID=E6QT11_9ZZZZ
MPSTAGQIGAIALGGLAGAIGLRAYGTLPSSEDFPVHYRKRWGIFLLSLFALLLLGLPILNTTLHNDGVELFDRFYRVGALVFGGGHVVLPLLQAQVVPSGWVSNDSFLAGYGATQAVPGPLFTFAAYLGAVSTHAPGGWIGAMIALVAIFLPSFLLVTGILPFWAQLRRHPHMQGAMKGVNAAVVGLLLAAFYQPVWHSAVLNAKDFSWVLGVFALLVFWKTPPWLAVILAVLVSALGWV